MSSHLQWYSHTFISYVHTWSIHTFNSMFNDGHRIHQGILSPCPAFWVMLKLMMESWPGVRSWVLFTHLWLVSMGFWKEHFVSFWINSFTWKCGLKVCDQLVPAGFNIASVHLWNLNLKHQTIQPARMYVSLQNYFTCVIMILRFWNFLKVLLS